MSPTVSYHSWDYVEIGYPRAQDLNRDFYTILWELETNFRLVHRCCSMTGRVGVYKTEGILSFKLLTFWVVTVQFIYRWSSNFSHTNLYSVGLVDKIWQHEATTTTNYDHVVLAKIRWYLRVTNSFIQRWRWEPG